MQERSNDTSNDQQKKSQRVSCVISKALVSSTIGEYDGPDYSARHPLQILPAVTTWKAPGGLTVKLNWQLLICRQERRHGNEAACKVDFCNCEKLSAVVILGPTDASRVMEIQSNLSLGTGTPPRETKIHRISTSITPTPP